MITKIVWILLLTVSAVLADNVDEDSPNIDAVTRLIEALRQTEEQSDEVTIEPETDLYSITITPDVQIEIQTESTHRGIEASNLQDKQAQYSETGSQMDGLAVASDQPDSNYLHLATQNYINEATGISEGLESYYDIEATETEEPDAAKLRRYNYNLRRRSGILEATPTPSEDLALKDYRKFPDLIEKRSGDMDEGSVQMDMQYSADGILGRMYGDHSEIRKLDTPYPEKCSHGIEDIWEDSDHVHETGEFPDETHSGGCCGHTTGHEAEAHHPCKEYEVLDPPYVGSLRGIPGVHYPNYTEIPITSFTCAGKKYIPGYYADVETDCQVFHLCYEHRRESFLCPVGTIFSQPILACDYWYSANCSASSDYYEVNEITEEEYIAEDIMEPEKVEEAEIVIQIIDELQPTEAPIFVKPVAPKPIIPVMPIKPVIKPVVVPPKPAKPVIKPVVPVIPQPTLSKAELATLKKIYSVKAAGVKVAKPLVKAKAVPIVAAKLAAASKARAAEHIAAMKAKTVAAAIKAVPVAKVVKAKTKYAPIVKALPVKKGKYLIMTKGKVVPKIVASKIAYSLLAKKYSIATLAKLVKSRKLRYVHYPVIGGVAYSY